MSEGIPQEGQPVRPAGNSPTQSDDEAAVSRILALGDEDRRRFVEFQRLFGGAEPSQWMLEHGKLIGSHRQLERNLYETRGELEQTKARLLRRSIYRNTMLTLCAAYGVASLVFSAWLYASGGAAQLMADAMAILFEMTKLQH